METRLRRIIRKRDLPNYTGLQRTALDELIRKGEFPPLFRLSEGGRAMGAWEDDIVAWQMSRRSTGKKGRV
jgi:predicted DNA-binding transcriptional regulator AlpA